MAEPVRFPVSVDLIPGKLTAQVHLHEIETRDGVMPCWTYISEGLQAYKHKEIIFTLRCASREQMDAFHTGPLHFFRAIHQCAKLGVRAEAGGFTEFGPPGFLGHADLRGLGYIPPVPLAGVDIPRGPYLAAIMLKGDELQVARTYGLARVVARLGYAYAYYPCPPWSDPERPVVVTMREMETSLLNRVLRCAVQGARVRLESEQEIVLWLLPSAAELFQAMFTQVPPDAVLGLQAEIDPRADACIVWLPGTTGINVIGPQNSSCAHMAGAFIIFCPQQVENRCTIVEDGFVLLLTDRAWTDVRQALSSGTDISIPATGAGYSFALRWTPPV